MNTKGNVEQEQKREQREALMFVWIPQEQTHNMEAIEEQKSQEDQTEGSTATEKEGMLWLTHVKMDFYVGYLSASLHLLIVYVSSRDVPHF